MKKMITLVLCIAMAFSMVACSTQSGKTTDTSNEALIGGDPATWGPDENDDNALQPASPFIDCDTMKKASEMAGFDITVPESIDGYEKREIQAVENTMIQVNYLSDDTDVMIRKGIGQKDISGDYTDYETEKTVTVDDSNVTVKLNGDKAYLATWTNGEHAFAVQAEAGMDMESMTGLIQSVK